MLRPRPISEDVRLRIVWNQEDEDSVYTRDSEEYSELEEGVPELRQQHQAQVEIPSWRVLDRYKDSPKPNWTAPRQYIKSPNLGYIVEYDLDDQDEEWLAGSHNAYVSKDQRYKIDEDTLETTIDYLEKCSFKQMEFQQVSVTPAVCEEDEGDLALCCVCGKRSKREEFIVCAGCELSVHFDCAGIPKEVEHSIAETEESEDISIDLEEGGESVGAKDTEGEPKSSTKDIGNRGGLESAKCRKEDEEEEEVERLKSGLVEPDEIYDSSSLGDEKVEQSKDANDDINDEVVRGKSPWVCDRCQYCNVVSPDTPKPFSEADKVKYKSRSTTVECFSCSHPGGLMKKLEIDRKPGLYLKHVTQHTVDPTKVGKGRATSPLVYTRAPNSPPKRVGRKSQGDFVHLVCAMFVPKFSLAADGTAFLSGEETYPTVACSFCGFYGGVILCSKSSCRNFYHPSCAVLNHQLLDVRDKKLISFCPRHTMKYLQDKKNTEVRVVLGRFIDEDTKLKIQDILEKRIPSQAFRDMCDYWKDKRWAVQAGRKPLIGRLVEEADTLSNELLNNIERTRTLDVEDKYDQLLEVRNGMEKSRLLLDLIKKRELVKLGQARCLLEYVNYMLKERMVDERIPRNGNKNKVEIEEPRARGRRTSVIGPLTHMKVSPAILLPTRSATTRLSPAPRRVSTSTPRATTTAPGENLDESDTDLFEEENISSKKDLIEDERPRKRRKVVHDDFVEYRVKKASATPKKRDREKRFIYKEDVEEEEEEEEEEEDEYEEEEEDEDIVEMHVEGEKRRSTRRAQPKFEQEDEPETKQRQTRRRLSKAGAEKHGGRTREQTVKTMRTAPGRVIKRNTSDEWIYNDDPDEERDKEHYYEEDKEEKILSSTDERKTRTSSRIASTKPVPPPISTISTRTRVATMKPQHVSLTSKILLPTSPVTTTTTSHKTSTGARARGGSPVTTPTTEITALTAARTRGGRIRGTGNRERQKVKEENHSEWEEEASEGESKDNTKSPSKQRQVIYYYSSNGTSTTPNMPLPTNPTKRETRCSSINIDEAVGTKNKRKREDSSSRTASPSKKGKNDKVDSETKRRYFNDMIDSESDEASWTETATKKRSEKEMKEEGDSRRWSTRANHGASTSGFPCYSSLLNRGHRT